MTTRVALLELRKKLTEIYPFGGPKRFLPIPEDKVSWEVDWPEYNPPEFTSKHVLANPPWADPNLPTKDESLTPKWNKVDGVINRVSYSGIYKLEKGFPLNPAGRTGIKGRGNLGKWGPNHAADPIVTRWKPNENSKILQFIGIQRRDSGEWAIPGGMIDAGEESASALMREFLEEVFSVEEGGGSDLKTESEILDNGIRALFKNGEDIYRGYVDDPRNTDNAWMETHAVNFHASGEVLEILSKFPFKAGSDAKGAGWIDISSKLSLHASHVNFIRKVAEIKGAVW